VGQKLQKRCATPIGNIALNTHHSKMIYYGGIGLPIEHIDLDLKESARSMESGGVGCGQGVEHNP
jgi:hypothetical protein